MGDAQISPSPANYMIGKGVVSIAKITNGTAGSYVDVGNCPRFEYEPTEQSIEHFSSRQNVKEQDHEAVIQTGYNLNITLDEISVENLRMFLKGTMSGTNVIFANQNLNQLYAIKFVSDNSVGPNVKYEFHKVKLTPNGAFSLIGDEYSTLNFTGKGLSDRANNSTNPWFKATFETTTTAA